MTELSAETLHETCELLLLSFPGVIKILKGEKGGKKKKKASIPVCRKGLNIMSLTSGLSSR